MNNEIEQLLQRPDLWRASATARRTETICTGYQQLNRALHDGGWPHQGLIELLLARVGIGELRLLMPALAKLSQSPGWIVFIGCPFLPYAAALQAYDVNLSRILLIQPGKRQQHKDLLWAAEQALASGSCHCVLSWLHTQTVASKALRKLQLAAQKGNSMGVLFRDPQTAQQVSPAKLRIQLSAAATAPNGERGLQLDILKQPGGWGGQSLQLSNPLNALQTMPTQQLPVHRPKLPQHESHDNKDANLSPVFPSSKADHSASLWQ